MTNATFPPDLPPRKKIDITKEPIFPQDYIADPWEGYWVCAVCGKVTSTPHEHSIEDQEGQ